MDLAGRSLRTRITEALVVFAVLAGFAAVRGEFDWVFLVAVPIAFLAVTLGIDAVRTRLSG